MNKILEFFYKYLAVVVFFVLEILAFLLVVNKNDLQRSVAFRSATALSAWTHGITNSVTDYFGLAEANRYLAEENARLYKEIADYKTWIADSLVVQSTENYLSAKVVYNSVYDLQNYIIIDKGSAQGIEEDMGVFAPQGVVGVVQCVSKNYAVVLPIINPEQEISAKIKGNNQTGYCCAYIGTHDNTNSLYQCKKPCIHKTYHHYGSSRGRLNDSSDTHTCQYSLQRIGCHGRQESS